MAFIHSSVVKLGNMGLCDVENTRMGDEMRKLVPCLTNKCVDVFDEGINEKLELKNAIFLEFCSTDGIDHNTLLQQHHNKM